MVYGRYLCPSLSHGLLARDFDVASWEWWLWISSMKSSFQDSTRVAGLVLPKNSINKMDHHHHHHREPLGQQSYSANFSEPICLYILNFWKKAYLVPFFLGISTNICDVDLWDSVTRILRRLETLSNNDRESSENATWKENSRFFKLYHHYYTAFGLIERWRITLGLNMSFPSYKKT